MKFKCLVVVLVLAYGCNSNSERVTQKLDNGDIMVTERIDGKKIQKVYTSTNVLRSELNVVDSTVTGTLTSFFDNGKVFQVSEVKNGVVHGFQKTYDGSGAVIREYTYKEGRKEGIGKAYYPNGKLRAEATYLKGKPNGIVVEYDESGKVIPGPKIVVDVKNTIVLDSKITYFIQMKPAAVDLDVYVSFPAAKNESGYRSVKIERGVARFELYKGNYQSLFGEIGIYVEYKTKSGLLGKAKTTVRVAE